MHAPQYRWIQSDAYRFCFDLNWLYARPTLYHNPIGMLFT